MYIHFCSGFYAEKFTQIKNVRIVLAQNYPGLGEIQKHVYVYFCSSTHCKFQPKSKTLVNVSLQQNYAAQGEIQRDVYVRFALVFTLKILAKSERTKTLIKTG